MPLERLRGRIPIVAVCLALFFLANSILAMKQMRDPKIVFGDQIQYLDAAYHLSHHGTFSESAEHGATEPAVGREPMYPLLLAILMRVDPGMASYRPACADPAEGCDAGRLRAASVANLVMIQMAALLAFALARRLARSDVAALVAAGYILLNVNLLRSHWYDPMSDELALLLVSAAMLAIACAWGRNAPLRWLLVGLALAALTLTKAIFLPFSLGLAVAAGVHRAWRGTAGGLRGHAPAVAVAVYAALVGGWMARNQHVAGSFRLTDSRGGIALSTREVFDHMTPAQIAAAFVYWTPGGGEALANRIFPPETVAPFELYAPGGFYDRGQNGYGRRVEAEMASEGVSRAAAERIVDHALVAEILAHPFGYLASLPPLVYRGLWFDQFALLSLPLLVWMTWRTIRTGDRLVALLLGFGLYNEAFYALFSLNIQRYQITAMPALALATALACRDMAARLASPASRVAG